MRLSRARPLTQPWLVAGVLVALLALNYLIPIGRVTFDSRVAESFFYAALVFSPMLCAGLLFGSAIARSTALTRDYGTTCSERWSGEWASISRSSPAFARCFSSSRCAMSGPWLHAEPK